MKRYEFTPRASTPGPRSYRAADHAEQLYAALSLVVRVCDARAKLPREVREAVDAARVALGGEPSFSPGGEIRGPKLENV